MNKRSKELITCFVLALSLGANNNTYAMDGSNTKNNKAKKSSGLFSSIFKKKESPLELLKKAVKDFMKGYNNFAQSQSSGISGNSGDHIKGYSTILSKLNDSIKEIQDNILDVEVFLIQEDILNNLSSDDESIRKVNIMFIQKWLQNISESKLERVKNIKEYVKNLANAELDVLLRYLGINPQNKQKNNDNIINIINEKDKKQNNFVNIINNVTNNEQERTKINKKIYQILNLKLKLGNIVKAVEGAFKIENSNSFKEYFDEYDFDDPNGDGIYRAFYNPSELEIDGLQKVIDGIKSDINLKSENDFYNLSSKNKNNKKYGIVFLKQDDSNSLRFLLYNNCDPNDPDSYDNGYMYFIKVNN